MLFKLSKTAFGVQHHPGRSAGDGDHIAMSREARPRGPPVAIPCMWNVQNTQTRRAEDRVVVAGGERNA